MAIYQVSKPSFTNKQWAKFILPRIIVPPILLWDAVKLGVNKLLGNGISYLVLPAQIPDPVAPYPIIDNASVFNTSELTCQKHTIITHDDVQLDTFEVNHHAQLAKELKYQKYIIHFGGNGISYTKIIDELLSDAQVLKANVIGFDWRGVNQCTGQPQSKDDLVTDGIAQVQRLLDIGVSPENITLKGHSLGAGIASLVAYHFHQQGKPINVFSSRSFSSITDVLVGHIRLKRDTHGRPLGQEETTSGKILGWSAKPFIKFGLEISNWEINAAEAFRQIPEEYREYITIRTRKNLRAGKMEDPVIPFYASIYNNLEDKRDAKNTSHPSSQTKAEDEQSALVIKESKTIKNARKMETEAWMVNGHDAPCQAIHNRYGQSGFQFFRQFVRDADKSHGINEQVKP